MPVNSGNTSTSACMRQPDRHVAIEVNVRDAGFVERHELADDILLPQREVELHGIGQRDRDSLNVIQRSHSASSKSLSRLGRYGFDITQPLVALAKRSQRRGPSERPTRIEDGLGNSRRG